MRRILRTASTPPSQSTASCSPTTLQSSILFRYSDKTIQGNTFGLAASFYTVYTLSYNSFVAVLGADQISPNDTTALENLPSNPIATHVQLSSANGRALGLKTTGAIDSSGGLTGTFDGIVSLNSTQPFLFGRAGGIGPGNYDAQRSIEHEIDEVLGLGSILDQSVSNQIKPEDFFRYSTDSGAPALTLNPSQSATSYFSIDGGSTNLVGFSQNSSGDRGDWLSPNCAAQAVSPLVQYAFSCTGIVADISATSPEGIALDVIGYDLAAPPSGSPVISPFGVVPVFSKATAIQPGSWASIYGSNLSNVRASWKGDFPTELGGTTVAVNGKAAYLWFVSPGQINFQAPDDTTAGPVNVTVTTSGGNSTSTVTLAPASPSFSLLDAAHVAAVILRTDGSGTYGAGANSYDIVGPTGTSLGYTTIAAKAGDSVVVFGVGFGPTNPFEFAGRSFAGAASTISPVKVQINNTVVTPSFAGLSSAGLYQINLTIPAGAGSGDVPLVAIVDGASTQATVVLSLQ